MVTFCIPHANGDEVSDAGFASVFHHSPEHGSSSRPRNVVNFGLSLRTISKTSVTTTIKKKQFYLSTRKSLEIRRPKSPNTSYIIHLVWVWVTPLTAPTVHRIICPSTPTDWQSAYRTVHYATNSRFTVAKDWFLTSVTRRQENIRTFSATDESVITQVFLSLSLDYPDK